MRWMTLTHAQRWKQAHHAVGEGHLYQGRFKSFPVQDDRHFLTVLRYIERNPLRARLVKRAEAWRWASLYARREPAAPLHDVLTASELPVDLPRNWLSLVNESQREAEEQQVRLSIARSRPLGDEAWTRRTAGKLKLEWTLRSPGRPKGWRKAKGRK
jgi:putative transposase